MKIGILGTGMVGETLGAALIARGHDVKMGSRSATNDKAAAWAEKAGPRASQGTFADAASFGEVAILCTNGGGAVAAATSAAAGLDGKLVLDTTNPLDFAKGFPPSLFFRGDDSLGEQVQKAVPGAKVVKALNTINANLMTDPKRVGGGMHDLLIAGNDDGAKQRARELLDEWFGWEHVIDLGDITGARATESYLVLWVRLMKTFGTPDFTIRVVR